MNKFALLFSLFLLIFNQQACAKAAYQENDTQKINNQKAQIKTIKAIFQLAQDNQFMNLKAVGQAFGESDLYNKVTQNAFDESVVVFYNDIKDNPNHALNHIRFQVWLNPYEMDISELLGSVEFSFKENQCPSIELIEEVTGVKADKHEIPYSPSSVGRVPQFLTYTQYYFQLPKQWIGFFDGSACRMELSTVYKPVGFHSQSKNNQKFVTVFSK